MLNKKTFVLQIVRFLQNTPPIALQMYKKFFFFLGMYAYAP